MTESPFLLKNFEYMTANKSPAAVWLAQVGARPEDASEGVFVNRAGRLDYRLQSGTGLMEAVRPDVFYAAWTNNLAEAGATFVVGANLGYGVNHLLVNSPRKHAVFVLEPRPDMLMRCLGQTDYTEFMAMGKLHFLPPHKELLRAVVEQLDVQFLFGKIHLHTDLPSRQLGPEYSQWTRLAREAMEGVSVELSTLRLRQDDMVGNELGNYARSMADGCLDGLKDAGQGLTAVLLGAGPSLALSAPCLRQGRDRALYVSALQTLPSLQAVGIKPHLCMAIDYSHGMNKIYNRLDPEWAKDIPLVYSTKVHPEVVARYPGPTIPVWTMGGMGTYVLKDSELVLDAGGNVGVALVRLLHWCGVKDFVFAGQDFAWRKGATHAPGHHAQTYGGRTVPLKDLDGREIYSAMPFVTSLRDMEADIAALGLSVTNLYAGGAPITGAEHVRVEHLEGESPLGASLPSPDGFLEALSRANSPRPRPRFEQRARQWGESLRNAQKRLEKLFKKCGKNQAAIHEVLKQCHYFLRQDPLYLPYLYNEVMDMAGLARARSRYTAKDLVIFKDVKKRVLAKVREMDAALAAPAQAEAADSGPSLAGIVGRRAA